MFMHRIQISKCNFNINIFIFYIKLEDPGPRRVVLFWQLSEWLEIFNHFSAILEMFLPYVFVLRKISKISI